MFFFHHIFIRGENPDLFLQNLNVKACFKIVAYLIVIYAENEYWSLIPNMTFPMVFSPISDCGCGGG